MTDLTTDQHAFLLAVARDAVREGWAEYEYDPIFWAARKLGVKLTRAQVQAVAAEARRITARP